MSTRSILRLERLSRSITILVTCIAHLLAVQCATAPVKPYQVTNFFRSSRIEERDIRRIAVLPIENLTDERFAGPIVAEQMNLQLGKLGVFDLVERSRITELFKEQDLDTLKRFDASTAVEIGKMLGAQGVVMGSVTKFRRHPSDKRDTLVIVEHEHHHHSLWEDEWYYQNYNYPPPSPRHHQADTNEVRAAAIIAGAILVVSIIGIILYLALKPRPTAEIGANLRLVDVETGEVVWQAEDVFQGNRKGVQALVSDKTDKARLVTDVEYLNQVFCQELARTLLVQP